MWFNTMKYNKLLPLHFNFFLLHLNYDKEGEGCLILVACVQIENKLRWGPPIWRRSHEIYDNMC